MNFVSSSIFIGNLFKSYFKKYHSSRWHFYVALSMKRLRCQLTLIFLLYSKFCRTRTWSTYPNLRQTDRHIHELFHLFRLNNLLFCCFCFFSFLRSSSSGTLGSGLRSTGMLSLKTNKRIHETMEYKTKHHMPFCSCSSHNDFPFV